MKKTFATTIVLLICALFVFAGTANMQKIYSVDSQEYMMIKYLYIAQGHSLPSTTGPWSADELANMLKVLDTSSMDSVQKAWYDAVDASINARPEIDLVMIVSFSISQWLDDYQNIKFQGPHRLHNLVVRYIEDILIIRFQKIHPQLIQEQ